MVTEKQRKNIFILGYDEEHGEDVRRIPDVDDFNFYPLLRSEELVHQKNFDIMDKLDAARKILREFNGQIHGIVCHWDFPSTPIWAMLCEEFGLRAPSLRSVVTCSHKYWSRLEQRKAAPENTPEFCAVDPFDDEALDKITVDYPFWIKPVTGYSSLLGFRIENDEQFREAMQIARDKIDRIGNQFSRVLEQIDLPPEIASITGNHMIAEQLIKGREIAPEGYMQHGKFHVHGMFDMVFAENGTSFLRYEYPCMAPLHVQERAIRVAEKVLTSMGFDNGCFNMEFFWDEDTDNLWIVEINPRISQSHSYQFEQVDGMSNHEVAIHVALGDTPLFSHGSGPHTHAAKYLLRRYDLSDGVATRVPEKADLDRLAEEQPDTRIVPQIAVGEKLSDLIDQDAYSYVLAEVMVAGDTVEEMEAKFRRVRELLPFEFEPL